MHHRALIGNDGPRGNCDDGHARAAVSALDACGAGEGVGTSVADAALGSIAATARAANMRISMTGQRSGAADRRTGSMLRCGAHDVERTIELRVAAGFARMRAGRLGDHDVRRDPDTVDVASRPA